MTKKIGVSQNGWPVYDDTKKFVRFTVAGVGFWAATADVATVLADWVTWYHNTIEKITLPVRETPGYDDWSYAVRPVRGQTSGYSNHGSATAVDLNATRHPRGVKGTHTQTERTKMAARLKYYEGVLRCGEFYTGTVDGMHIEVDDDRDAVARIAAKIRDAAKPAPEKEKQMDLNSVVTYTEKAAKRLDKKTTTVAEILQWSPGVRIARDEIAGARDTVLTALVSARGAILAKIGEQLNQGAVIGEEVGKATAGIGELNTKLDQVLALLQTEPE